MKTDDFHRSRRLVVSRFNGRSDVISTFLLSFANNTRVLSLQGLTVYVIADGVRPKMLIKTQISCFKKILHSDDQFVVTVRNDAELKCV